VASLSKLLGALAAFKIITPRDHSNTVRLLLSCEKRLAAMIFVAIQVHLEKEDIQA
jgi:hypothetical protein